MNNKQMLCIALAILHTESQLNTPNTDHEIIRKVIRECKLPEYVEEDDERGSLLVLKDIISNIVDGDVEYDKTSILKQIKLESTQNKAFYESIVEYLSDEDLPEEIEKRLVVLSKQLGGLYFQLRNALSTITLRQTMGKAFGALNGTETRTDLETCLDNLKTEISTYSSRSHSKIPSLVADLSTSNPTHFIKVFDSIAEKAAGGGLQTGWKSINRMMGVMGGLSEEMWLMPALPFNCKSLFSLCMSISIPLFNTPEHAMRNVKGTKQPIILDLSLENEVDINIAMAYQMIYGHFEGVAPDMESAGVTVDSKSGKTKVNPEGSAMMANYFCDKLQKNGWTYRFQKHTNDNFKVHYIQDLINDLEQQGYHVVGIRADYLGTINKHGHGNGIAGSDIKEIYRIARNIQIVKNKGFLLGPHQISPEGKRLRAIDEAAFVKSLPGRGLYDTCSSLDNEADAEMFFGKRVIEGRSYLEVQRGKHRTIVDTDQKHHYTVLPFSEVGILPWDVDREEEVTANSINKFAGGFGEDCVI